mmetsp:Transcript_81811/g.227843  ORF Transcript_81811/g.227843 Transcript_81811/m.227843 type:complete len:440 (-) Transcript_81811:495-1814(-)
MRSCFFRSSPSNDATRTPIEFAFAFASSLSFALPAWCSRILRLWSSISCSNRSMLALRWSKSVSFSSRRLEYTCSAELRDCASASRVCCKRSISRRCAMFKRSTSSFASSRFFFRVSPSRWWLELRSSASARRCLRSWCWTRRVSCNRLWWPFASSLSAWAAASAASSRRCCSSASAATRACSSISARIARRATTSSDSNSEMSLARLPDASFIASSFKDAARASDASRSAWSSSPLCFNSAERRSSSRSLCMRAWLVSSKSMRWPLSRPSSWAAFCDAFSRCSSLRLRSDCSISSCEDLCSSYCLTAASRAASSASTLALCSAASRRTSSSSLESFTRASSWPVLCAWRSSCALLCSSIRELMRWSSALICVRSISNCSDWAVDAFARSSSSSSSSCFTLWRVSLALMACSLKVASLCSREAFVVLYLRCSSAKSRRA